MRRGWLGMAVVLGLSAFAPSARAQLFGADPGAGDPFFLYYGYFLPRQQALANQRGPELMISDYSARRQQAAYAEREAVFSGGADPFAADLDPLRPFGSRGSASRIARPTPNGVTHQNLSGTGPALYYNRVGSYYPGLRSGRGPNANVAVGGRGAYSGGGMRGGAGLGAAMSAAGAGFR